MTPVEEHHGTCVCVCVCVCERERELRTAEEQHWLRSVENVWSSYFLSS